MSGLDDTPEDRVCVACKAATERRFAVGDPANPIVYHVCQECHDDGSFVSWVAEQLERALDEAGYESRIGPDGRKIYRTSYPSPGA